MPYYRYRYNHPKLKVRNKMKISIFRNTLVLGILFACFSPHPLLAKDSGWMKISKIESYGRYLKRNKLIPYDIKCKRPNTAGGWYSGLFKVRTRQQTPSNIRGWRMAASKASNSGIASQLGGYYSGQSRSIVRPGKSGVGIICEIFHMN